MSWEEVRPMSDLDQVPTDWSKFTLEQKVQKQLDVIEAQLSKVRSGTFDISNGERVAALVLECQMTLAEFYADSELAARNGKDTADYIEAEAQTQIAADTEGKKPSDLTLKRLGLTKLEVKEARKRAAEAEKEFKKWRWVWEMLKDAHILFRNISKIQ